MRLSGCLQITVKSGRTITVGIWDTAGAEQFESLSRMYYHGSKAAIVCFDAYRAASFKKLQFWVRAIDQGFVQTTFKI